MQRRPTNGSASPTGDRLLDAAERLFAERGLDGVSVREITAAAGANLAAVNYHFGSKLDLFDAVVARRFEPLNRERIRLLDEAEARAGGRPVPVERILEALVAPALRMSRDPAQGGPELLRLVGRMQVESGATWRRFFARFGELRRRASAALGRALPELSAEELAWRTHFAVGAMVNVMADHHRLEELSGGLCSSGDVDGAVRRLVPFLAAGLRAPVAAAPRPARRRRAPRPRSRR